MTDELDSMDFVQLSETFATEVAGWKHEGPVIIAAKKGGIIANWKNANGDWVYDPTFATDANAVLPWLGKHQNANSYAFGIWMIRIIISDSRPIKILAEASAPTFPRAACIALIRAKRAEKQQQGETP